MYHRVNSWGCKNMCFAPTWKAETFRMGRNFLFGEWCIWMAMLDNVLKIYVKQEGYTLTVLELDNLYVFQKIYLEVYWI